MGLSCMSKEKDQNDNSGFQTEVALVKFVEWAKLMKQRKENEILRQQKNLVALIRGNNRNRDEQFYKMRNIVNLCKELRVITYQINYGVILRRNIGRITPKKNVEQFQNKDLQNFQTYFQSLHFINSKKPSQYYQVVEQKFFSYIEMMNREDKIPQEVFECFKTVVPTDIQMSQYMSQMCLRNEISQETLTKIGHKFLINQNDTKLYTIPMAVDE